MSRHCSLKCVTVVLLFLVAAASANASTLSVLAQALACWNGLCDVQLNNVPSAVTGPIVVSPLNASAGGSNGISTGNSAATSYGSVQYGMMSAFVSSSGDEASSVLLPGATSGNPNGRGYFQGQWTDTMTMGSSTLQVNDPISLLFTLSMNANLVCAGPHSSATADAAFTAGFQHISLSDHVCNTAFVQSQSLQVDTFVGAVLNIAGLLQLDSRGSGLNLMPSSSEVDPPTSSFFIDVITAGGSYTTATGTNYSTPSAPAAVPEPGCLMLVAPGLLGLGRMLRGRRRG